MFVFLHNSHGLEASLTVVQSVVTGQRFAHRTVAQGLHAKENHDSPNNKFCPDLRSWHVEQEHSTSHGNRDVFTSIWCQGL